MDEPHNVGGVLQAYATGSNIDEWHFKHKKEDGTILCWIIDLAI
jgi:hypothetical protein